MISIPHGREVEVSEFAPGYKLLSMAPPGDFPEGEMMEFRGERFVVVQDGRSRLEFSDRPGQVFQRCVVLVRPVAQLSVVR